MSKHTPGPWSTTWTDDPLQEERYVIANPIPGQPMLIADCLPDSPDDFGLPQVEEYQDNARLIAAAPDMLESLQKVLFWWSGTDSFIDGEDEMPADVFDSIRFAIRDATGGPAPIIEAKSKAKDTPRLLETMKKVKAWRIESGADMPADLFDEVRFSIMEAEGDL